ncbi:MAG: UDP-N-acetylmuramate:L-alanyl-gamma-D-glutamyl-meso-diaminopimelate ligase [Pseudomonadota bacterium]|nr:UDP-N-acetylmuramate:L-alanyl-gamma-D-glutamyl-meso-diaminopimelate ligase [Pseudomonadota bacterium]
MHLHILGICGTFMGGIAVIARQAGHTVTGCDANVYPPMSTQLEAQGIRLIEGFGVEQLALEPDIWVVGNVVARGKQPLMEEILNRGLPYISGPQWLAENVLQNKWVLAAAGTHGKTTTASMLAWILEDCGLSPGYLIGGVPMNFGVSARLAGTSVPDSPFFVIEADEYDTAFFDKRSKFVHYHPRTAILNNLEYDHADIFPDLAAIETQFHHLVRTVPGNGLIVANGREESLDRVIQRGCWTPVERFGALPPSPTGGGAGGEGARMDSAASVEQASVPHPQPLPRGGRGAPRWRAEVITDSTFDVYLGDRLQGRVEWSLQGEHNRMNALAAIAAARHAGVPSRDACAALGRFENVKRRMEVRGEIKGVKIFDDFAHHPTAIATTLAGLRANVGGARILAVLEPRSNTMKLGVMKAALADSLREADHVFCYSGGIDWDAAGALAPLGEQASIHADLDELVEAIADAARPGDQVLVMSNGGFGGIHERLLRRLGA